MNHDTGTTLRVQLPPDAIFAQASPAVVQVVIQDRQGRSVASGSGFLVSRAGLIATNYHVIEQAHTAHIILADKTKLSVMGVAALDEDADIAIIKVAGQINAQPLILARDDLPPVGTKVYAIGNPRGFTHTLSDGLVSALREEGALVRFPRITMIQTTAPISPGSSGGPLVRTDGMVVGVTTISRVDGQNLNFAVPTSHVARLLLRCEGEGHLTPFPVVRVPAAVPYIERGIAWAREKEYDKAIEEFNEAIRLDPKSVRAYNQRGIAWARKKDNDKAFDDFNSAIRLDPNFAMGYNNRGRSLLEKKEYDKAIRDFDEAIRLDPSSALANNNRDIALSRKKELRNDDLTEKIKWIKARLRPGPIKFTELEQIMGGRPHKVEPLSSQMYVSEFKRTAGLFACIRRYYPFQVPGESEPRYRVNLLFQGLQDPHDDQLTSWYFRSPD